MVVGGVDSVKREGHPTGIRVNSRSFPWVPHVSARSRQARGRVSGARGVTTLSLPAHVACRVVNNLFPGAQQCAEYAVGVVTHMQGNG